MLFTFSHFHIKKKIKKYIYKKIIEIVVFNEKKNNNNSVPKFNQKL